jgi:hypothetical protein
VPRTYSPSTARRIDSSRLAIPFGSTGCGDGGHLEDSSPYCIALRPVLDSARMAIPAKWSPSHLWPGAEELAELVVARHSERRLCLEFVGRFQRAQPLTRKAAAGKIACPPLGQFHAAGLRVGIFELKQRYYRIAVKAKVSNAVRKRPLAEESNSPYSNRPSSSIPALVWSPTYVSFFAAEKLATRPATLAQFADLAYLFHLSQ